MTAKFYSSMAIFFCLKNQVLEPVVLLLTYLRKNKAVVNICPLNKIVNCTRTRTCTYISFRLNCTSSFKHKRVDSAHPHVAKKPFKVEVYTYLKFSTVFLVVRLLSVSFKRFLTSSSLSKRKEDNKLLIPVLTRNFGLGGYVPLWPWNPWPISGLQTCGSAKFCC